MSMPRPDFYIDIVKFIHDGGVDLWVWQGLLGVFIQVALFERPADRGRASINEMEHLDLALDGGNQISVL